MNVEPGSNLVPLGSSSLAIARANSLAAPSLILDAGPAAEFCWEEFFSGTIRNAHTRKAYLRAVRRFLNWAEVQAFTLHRITPGMVGRFLDEHPGSIPSKKLDLAALRAFFDVLVQRHVIVLNPAASVRTERYQVMEGLTPEITKEQARTLLSSIDTSTLLGLRDKAIIACLVFTAARAGAVAKLKIRHLEHDGSQYVLKFGEKGGKQREIPVRHDLQAFLLDYLCVGGLTEASKDSPLFRTIPRRQDVLTGNAITGVDICRLVKRRLRDAGLPNRLSPHSFRVCTVTDLLSQGIPLEDVQSLAGHADPRTTRLYDRRQRKITRNIVERISV